MVLAGTVAPFAALAVLKTITVEALRERRLGLA